MPLAEPLVLPESSHRLLAQIRLASLEHFERARRFERLRLHVPALVLPGAVIAFLVTGLPALVGLLVALAGWLLACRGLAEYHDALVDRLGAVARELDRSGRALTPEHLCYLQVRLDLLLGVPVPGWWRLAAGRWPAPCLRCVGAPAAGLTLPADPSSRLRRLPAAPQFFPECAAHRAASFRRRGPGVTPAAIALLAVRSARAVLVGLAGGGCGALHPWRRLARASRCNPRSSPRGSPRALSVRPGLIVPRLCLSPAPPRSVRGGSSPGRCRPPAGRVGRAVSAPCPRVGRARGAAATPGARPALCCPLPGWLLLSSSLSTCARPSVSPCARAPAPGPACPSRRHVPSSCRLLGRRRAVVVESGAAFGYEERPAQAAVTESAALLRVRSAARRRSWDEASRGATACSSGPRQGRSCYSPNAKGNFQFDRMITGWRDRPVLDCRLKK